MNKMNCSFKKKFSFSKRSEESTRILSKYSDKIPIIVTKSDTCDLPDIDKNKFLVPAEITLAQFMYVIRRRINLSSEESIFLFLNNNVLAHTSATLGSLYQEHKDKDGFLYLVYCNENAFGN